MSGCVNLLTWSNYHVPATVDSCGVEWEVGKLGICFCPYSFMLWSMLPLNHSFHMERLIHIETQINVGFAFT